MSRTRLIVLVSAVLLLSAIAMADREDRAKPAISEENASKIAIAYAKSNLNASNSVAVKEIELNDGMYAVELTDGDREYELLVDSGTGAATAKKHETNEKEEEKQKEEKEREDEHEEKEMKFNRSGDSYAGKFVSFRYSDGSIKNYVLSNKSIFESVTISNFTPSKIKLEGSELKMEDETDDREIELEIHDNPTGLMKIKSEDGTRSITFTLSSGIGASVNGSKVTLTGIDAAIISLGKKGGVSFSLSGNVLTATIGEEGSLMFRAVSAKAETEQEKEHEEQVRNGIADGKIGGMATISGKDSSDVVIFNRITMSVESVANNSVTLEVSSDLPEGKTVLITISKDILDVVGSRDIRILFDGAEIQQASNYQDVMDPTNDGGKAEYLLLVGADEVQALVSVPKFSTHEITVSKVSSVVGTPGFAGIFGVLSMAAAVWMLARRK